MSKRLQQTDTDAAVPLCAAAALLPFPPTAGTVAQVTTWSSEVAGVVPQFDLQLSAAGACTLTGAILYGGRLRALTIADTTIDSVDHTVDQFTEATHGFKTGDGPVHITWATTPPPEIPATLDLYLIRTGASTFKVATTRALALAGTALAFSTNGTGAMTLADVQGSTDADDDTHRVHWMNVGALDATITLDVDLDWGVRVDHAADVIAYALAGTLSASTVTANLMPVQER